MAAREDDARVLLIDIQKRWRIVALEARIRELDEEAVKRWHWLEVTIEKFKLEEKVS